MEHKFIHIQISLNNYCLYFLRNRAKKHKHTSMVHFKVKNLESHGCCKTSLIS